ncbi:MAG: UxaA family hydrolase [Pleomorphochaeta sp.]
MKTKYIQIQEDDNVIIALEPIKKSEEININSNTFKVLEDINLGHKIAITNINKGDNIIKYGYPIGKAKCDIEVGSHVHTNNTITNLSEQIEYSYDEDKAIELNQIWKANNKVDNDIYINAYLRDNGNIAIRNDIWIIPTVGCVNKIATTLESWGNSQISNTNIDKVLALTHPYGCSQMGEDHENTKKILADLVNHPHAGGVLVLGLGCENNTIDKFKEEVGDYNPDRVKFLIAQESENEIEDSKNLLLDLINYAKKSKREKVSISKLKIGMKCGGSDGLSGISANPLVGLVCDKLASYNSSVILTEVPEMFGAEQILMDRCKNTEVFNSCVKLINDFKQYYIDNNQVVYENPSPGNKEGGITTLEDKSLGCVQKGGKAPIEGVLDYGDIIDKGGLLLLNGPGNDIVSTTNMSASGVNLILFTTGRGTPLGSVVPTVKIATNNKLATNKKNWIDFDASPILSENKYEIRDQLIDYIVKLSNGDIQSKNEINGYNEIAIFKNGVTL